MNSCYACKLYVWPVWLPWVDPKFLSQYFRFYRSLSFEQKSVLCTYVYKSYLEQQIYTICSMQQPRFLISFVRFVSSNNYWTNYDDIV